MIVNDAPSFLDYLFIAIKLFIIPYGSYFFGIYVRNKYLPERHSPGLRALMIIGIPICLVIISPILIAAEESLATITYAYFLTIGIIMEHGMVVHETAITRIKKRIKKIQQSED